MYYEVRFLDLKKDGQMAVKSRPVIYGKFLYEKILHTYAGAILTPHVPFMHEIVVRVGLG